MSESTNSGKRFLCRLEILSSYMIVTVGPYQVLGWYAGAEISHSTIQKIAFKWWINMD